MKNLKNGVWFMANKSSLITGKLNTLFHKKSSKDDLP